MGRLFAQTVSNGFRCSQLVDMDKYLMPTKSDIVSSGNGMKTSYPTVIAYGLDMTEMYKGRLLQAYDDYADGLMVPLDPMRYPEVPCRMHVASRGVFKRSNYRFGVTEDWTAIEKGGHFEVFSPEHVTFDHVRMVFGDCGVDEYIKVMESIEAYRSYVRRFERESARYHMCSGICDDSDDVHLVDGVFYFSCGTPVQLDYVGMCDYIRRVTGRVWSWMSSFPSSLK